MAEDMIKIKRKKILKRFFLVLIPVTLGAVSAWTEIGYFNALQFLVYLLMTVLLILAEDQLYENLEKAKNEDIEREKVNQKRIGLSVYILFLLFLAAVVFLVFKTGIYIAFIGLIMLWAALNYRMGISFRYKSFGSILISFIICPLVVAGSYYLQTNESVFIPIITAIPLFFLVTAVFHGEDLKNYEYHKVRGIRTLAVFMGEMDKKWAVYAQIENYIDAYLALAILIIFKVLPISAILPVALILPFIDLIKEIKGALSERRESFIKMPDSAFRFYSEFGILLILGIIFDCFLC